MTNSVFELRTYWIFRGDEFQTYEKLSLATFNAEDSAAALEASLRFIQGRMRDVPEYFKELGCVKLNILHIGPIDALGNLTTRSILRFFEWKCDYPSTLEEEIEHTINTLGIIR